MVGDIRFAGASKQAPERPRKIQSSQKPPKGRGKSSRSLFTSQRGLLRHSRRTTEEQIQQAEADESSKNAKSHGASTHC